MLGFQTFRSQGGAVALGPALTNIEGPYDAQDLGIWNHVIMHVATAGRSTSVEIEHALPERGLAPLNRAGLCRRTSTVSDAGRISCPGRNARANAEKILRRPHGPFIRPVAGAICWHHLIPEKTLCRTQPHYCLGQLNVAGANAIVTVVKCCHSAYKHRPTLRPA